MGYLHNDPCLLNAKPDEPMFVGLGRDPVAALMARWWARMSTGHQEPEWIDEALHIADVMAAYAAEHHPDKLARIDFTPVFGSLVTLRSARWWRSNGTLHEDREPAVVVNGDIYDNRQRTITRVAVEGGSVIEQVPHWEPLPAADREVDPTIPEGSDPLVAFGWIWPHLDTVSIWDDGQ